MKNSVLGVLVLITFGCAKQKHKETSEIVDPIDHSTIKVTDSIEKEYIKTLQELRLESDTAQNYASIKNIIKAEKGKPNYKKLSADSLSTFFKHSLVNRILPFWEGTEWSFEGHTAIPKKGQIACGYFVSTTLKDLGINLNRYKLAQQGPYNEAASLALDTEVITITNTSVEQNIADINSRLSNGIHFIGFESSHVGYVYKTKGELYLIHSNYVDYKGVEIEKIEASKAFASYQTFYIAELSSNEQLLRNWISGNEIKVIHQK